MYQTIRTVTDRFSLRDLVRTHTPQNGFHYLLDHVDRVINSPRTRALLESGELYGFYGHGQRAEHYRQTGNLHLNPKKTATVNGDPVIPAARTISIRLDGDVVEHTQAILDTPHGQLLDNMERGQIGGWSWAATGDDGARGAAINDLAGFDFVTHPGFISENRRPATVMMESAGMCVHDSQRNYFERHQRKGQRPMFEDSGHAWNIVPEVKAQARPLFFGSTPVRQFR